MNSKAAFGLAAGALVVGLLGGLALGGDGGDEPTKGPGPTKTVAGVPVGFEHSEQGAVRAALAFEGVLGGLANMPSESRSAALKELASDSSEQAILDAAQESLSFYDREFGQAGFLRSSVVGFRIAGYEGNAAEVELWEVSVVGRPDTAARSAWGTRRLALRWEGDWKLAKPPSDATGPTPTLEGTPTDPGALLSAARDLSEVRYVPPS